MSPNYPGMVFAFFSFLWSSFVRLLLCVTSSQSLHLGLLWGTAMPCPECMFRASAFSSIRSLAGVREPLFLLSFGLPVLKRSFIFWIYPLLLQSSQAVQRNIWQRMPFLSLSCFLLLSPPIGSCWISAVNSKATCRRCEGGVTVPHFLNFVVLEVLRLEPRTWWMLGMRSISELPPMGNSY